MELLLVLLLTAASTHFAYVSKFVIRTPADLKTAWSDPNVTSACLANDIQLSNEVSACRCTERICAVP